MTSHASPMDVDSDQDQQSSCGHSGSSDAHEAVEGLVLAALEQCCSQLPPDPHQTAVFRCLMTLEELAAAAPEVLEDDTNKQLFRQRLESASSGVLSQEVDVESGPAGTPVFWSIPSAADLEEAELRSRLALIEMELGPLQEKKRLVDSHIEWLHKYNEIKDVVQELLGLLANFEGCRVRDLYPKYNLQETD